MASPVDTTWFRRGLKVFHRASRTVRGAHQRALETPPRLGRGRGSPSEHSVGAEPVCAAHQTARAAWGAAGLRGAAGGGVGRGSGRNARLSRIVPLGSTVASG